MSLINSCAKKFQPVDTAFFPIPENPGWRISRHSCIESVQNRKTANLSDIWFERICMR